MLIVLFFFVFRLKIPTELIGYRGHSAFFFFTFSNVEKHYLSLFPFYCSVDVKERLKMN